ncbi:methyltransferase [Apodospora peruviana]|uniref:Methyltransferase n=1 Tax=Apodospora peruviana TaxID=516989 RepID=A0AAE0MBN2_9PEZI|nr:methyltransferase [Apodospora peruviana]
MGSSDDAPQMAVRYLDTATAYDLWSEVYDTDNNFLQALDSIEMQSLLPKLVSALEQSLPKPWKVVDLGCGTGRNTVHIVTLPDVAEIFALDLSPKMLDIARKRLENNTTAVPSNKKITFQVYDALKPSNTATTATPPDDADAVISTLVVEHVPLKQYFSAAAGMLKTGGLVLLTNMHSEMGKISQAGFVDPKTGEKIRPQSYAHTIDDVAAVARENGFEVAQEVEERMVTEENHTMLGPRAKKWIGVKVWYGGILRKV